MKTCGRCKERKQLNEFHSRGASGRQTWCKLCRRAYDAAYHQRTRAIRIAQKKALHAEIRSWYLDLKSNLPCADCGGIFHHAAMHWDHRPGQIKKTDVSNLLSKHNRKAILEEIKKCELVCANCHAVRTHERLRGVAQPG